MEQAGLHRALWWEEHNSGKLLCTLCPRYCTIGEGQHGFCYIRQNHNNILYTSGYGRPTGFAIDPIEKKPLNHFLPGSKILSFGTAGCNLGCKFCQNWSVSKAKSDENGALFVTPEQVVALAKQYHTPSIAFTYNDPVIFGEYLIDIARLAREEGIHPVMVTAGYIDKAARKEVFRDISAANVDLKAFSEHFYRKLTVSHLQDILDTLIWLRHETDIHTEITTLLIPDENDSDDEIKKMCGWILEHLGDDLPLHFTAFHPDYKMLYKKPTPPATVKRAFSLAKSAGIKYVYTGNIHWDEGQVTLCPSCGKELIKRSWHDVTVNRLDGGKCFQCGYMISGRFL
ncbi:MAG: AmmeMemoRadiSam system radical SAM enzyme [Ignavibacteriales bacterium]